MVCSFSVCVKQLTLAHMPPGGIPSILMRVSAQEVLRHGFQFRLAWILSLLCTIATFVDAFLTDVVFHSLHIMVIHLMVLSGKCCQCFKNSSRQKRNITMMDEYREPFVLQELPSSCTSVFILAVLTRTVCTFL